MADSAVSATIQVALETVISLAKDRVSLVLGFKKELERLCNTAETIRGFLGDADEKMLSPGVKNWLKQLESEVFEADNVLDELRYENLRREVKYRDQPMKKTVCFFFSFFNTVGFRSRLASKIRDINENLERINGQANDLGLVVKYQIEATFPAAGASTSRQTDSIVVPNVVGRANDESKIVDMLLSPSEKVLSVIPITGMGGLGKTTLAKSVYNDLKIDEHFGKRIWVCVAKEVEITELFKLILVQLGQEEVKVDDRNVIVTKIGAELRGQRYFLVLDDVWNHEQGLWNDCFNTLIGLNPNKGSWCLVTTRLEPVANAVSRTLKMDGGPYFLGKLSDDECWSILKEMVLDGEGVPQELEAVKNQILRRCEGLPLAARLIGGLLLSKGKEEWKSIVEESLSDEDKGEIKQILKVSFDHLSPAAVKKCFAYCSFFPQDTEMEHDLLIELWMAEGFVQPDGKDKRAMEEIGREYLRILLQSSLLEKVKCWWGIGYKMHDLVHDFAKSILSPGGDNGNYLALNSTAGMVEDVVTQLPASLRTLFLHLEHGIHDNMLSKFKNLHALKLSGKEVKILPISIGKLLHLRLLDISSSGIKCLSESVCKLYNLQTLRLGRGERQDNLLPKRMSDLISLRHLHYYNDAEARMPPRMGRLTCLQTLQFFNISQEKGCGIEELGTLKYLKGSLVIRNLGLVNDKEAAKQAKLFEKPNLLDLVLQWESGNQRNGNCYDEDVLEGLEPQPNLQRLEIHRFMGNKLPQWIMNLSPLAELQIKGCKRCRELPALGQLPSLKKLGLDGLSSIQFVGAEFYGITEEEDGRSNRHRKFFPVLEELRVESMESLVEWKDADQAEIFPILREFNILNCPQLTTLPSAGKNLSVLGCPNLASITAGYCTSLEDLMFSDCDNLRELPGDLLGSSLKELKLYNCPRLTALGVNRQKGKGPLTCLQEMAIVACHELTTIPGEIFVSCASLRELSVLNCSNLESFPLNLQETPSLESLMLLNCPKLIPDRLQGFAYATSLGTLSIGPFDNDCSSLLSAPALRVLELRGMPHSKSLPDQLQYLTTLTTLNLESFGNLEALPNWIGNLVSLEKLRLKDCKMLQSLPSETAMRCLTKFTSLEVRGCPLLRQRYNPQRGFYLEDSEVSSDPVNSCIQQ